MNARRLGLFGGTFDPPHVGHVAALRSVARTGRFSEIEVTVAGDPYLKTKDVSPAAQRLAMAREAFDGLDLVHVSDREIRRQGPSYTIDTVRELFATGAFDDVDLIVGADLVGQLDAWHEASALRDLVMVGVVPRPGSATTLPPGWRAYEIPMDPVDLSSTFIRSIAKNSGDLSIYLPAGVVPLYQGARD
ncbi:MAG: nicotinate-nicotinamide nucleotide adenylyltransferase [Acidobacteriota bacterium]|nr:nicotinate-nicotinamide nucleotide adenylyltransferase [Acidobacteriota bacterium]MDE3108234.1 nicotinate-nicotinamide nucleotide adenylyltransferase [Acidobacteriota bacterium]